MVSPREKLEDIETYADTLEELKFNSKPHISTLTELARDYGKNRQAGEVIKIIEKRIMHKDTPITHKMPTLYLLDSILKNHSNEYKRPIEAVLTKVFVCVFSNGDEKLRAAMFKLRSTWTEIFEYEILNVLDKRVQKIDPNWPIFQRTFTAPATKPQKAPSSNTAGNIHVNPKFLGEQKSFSEDSQDDGDDELRAMEEKIKQMRKEKEKKRKMKEMQAILEKERQELERVDRELKETEAKIPKISTSGSKTKDSSSSASTLKSSSSSKASNPKVCFMVKAC